MGHTGASLAAIPKGRGTLCNQLEVERGQGRAVRDQLETKLMDYLENV